MKYRNQMLLSSEVITEVVARLEEHKHDCEARVKMLEKSSNALRKEMAQDKFDKAKMTYDAFVDAYRNASYVPVNK